MFYLISGLGFIQSTMFCMRFCLVFVGLLVAAHAARSEEDFSVSDLDILKIQVERSDADWLIPYRIDANVMFTRSKDAGSAGSDFSSEPQIYVVAEPKPETAWATKSHWEITHGSGNTSLSPLLRFESKGVRIEIKPRLHSIWFIWRKAVNF